MECLPLTIAEVEYIAYRIAKETLGFDEPIPDFSSRFPDRLESCLVVPFHTFEGKDVYKNLIHKAAILFYVMIKNHPFQNGNKRIAVTTLLVFLLFNKKWLEVDPHSLYKFAVWVAESQPAVKNGVVHAIEEFVKKYLITAEDIQSRNE